MARQSGIGQGRNDLPHDPPFVDDILGNVRYAPFWLALRVAVGWLWLEAGWGRLGRFSTPFGQLLSPQPGRGADLVAAVLTIAGIALMLGALVGPVAFLGGCVSAGLWAGEGIGFAALQFAAVIWLILAWKTAGWIGLDRWLLPALGAPWRGGALFKREQPFDVLRRRTKNVEAHPR
jgi:thiosulfate dehydrogenase [quinone] large subunit